MVWFLAFLSIALLLFYLMWKRLLIGKSSTDNLNQIQDLFFRTVFTLLGYVAKRDGPVNKQEIKRTEVYMEKMALNAEQKREAIRLFKVGSTTGFDAESTIKEFYGLAKQSPNLAQILLVYLISLARVDGLLGEQETEAVRKVALGFGYSSITFKHLLEMVSSQYTFSEGLKKDNSVDKKDESRRSARNAHFEKQETSNNKPDDRSESVQSEKPKMPDGESCAEKNEDFNTRNDQLDEAYRVLGVAPSASDTEIKKAYRTLISQYHPDKLMGQGLPSYMIQSSKECFQAIQSAYEYIKEARHD